MSSYHFDIVTDGVATTEIVEAVDDDAAVRQALLLISEIVRDRALSNDDEVVVRLSVRDAADRIVWSGSATGGVD